MSAKEKKIIKDCYSLWYYIKTEYWNDWLATGKNALARGRRSISKIKNLWPEWKRNGGAYQSQAHDCFFCDQAARQKKGDKCEHCIYWKHFGYSCEGYAGSHREGPNFSSSPMEFYENIKKLAIEHGIEVNND